MASVERMHGHPPRAVHASKGQSIKQTLKARLKKSRGLGSCTLGLGAMECSFSFVQCTRFTVLPLPPKAYPRKRRGAVGCDYVMAMLFFHGYYLVLAVSTNTL